MVGGFTCHPSCEPSPEPLDDAAFDAALRLLTDRLGRLVEIDDGPKQEGGYCPKCGRNYQPNGTCHKCDRAPA